MKLANDVKNDIKQLLDTITVTTPLDINGSCECGQFECECETMQLTVACNDHGTEWNFQTGDNSYTGGAYSLPHWAVTYLEHGFDKQEQFEDIVDQLEELLSQ